MPTTIPAGFVPPFRVDDRFKLFIFDSENNVAASSVDGCYWCPRGWGRIQYLPNGDEQMDAWKMYFYDAQGRAGEDISVETLVHCLNNPPE
jgi:hypothetical protein